MAELVSAAGVAHNPFFPLIVRDRGPGAEEIKRLYREVATRLEASRPDTIVVFTTDHYNAFFDVCVPIFAVCTAERASGPCDYPQLPQFEVELDSKLALALQADLVAAGFDVAASQEIPLDHTILAPLGLIRPAMDVPLVPFFVSGSIPPRPPARRCYELGRSLRVALKRCPLPRRVALIASGAFSFEVGGPRIAEDSHVGVPAPKWAEHVVDRIRATRVDELIDEITPAQLERAGNASGEILNWIVMLGALDRSRPTFIESQPEHGHAFATWSVA